MARPTIRNEEVNRKIEEAAALGASVEEIAMYAGIHRDTLYDWMKKDIELSDRVRELQERPILKARQTIVKSLDNPQYATWYLSRKRKAEFSERIDTDITTGGEKLPPTVDQIALLSLLNDKGRTD